MCVGRSRSALPLYASAALTGLYSYAAMGMLERRWKALPDWVWVSRSRVFGTTNVAALLGPTLWVWMTPVASSRTTVAVAVVEVFDATTPNGPWK